MSGPKYHNRIELVQGTLDLLILQTLAWGPRHGYGISVAIRAHSGDVLRADTGSLYPALHRLERQGHIAARWEQSENKQRVKVYRLTAAGRKQLRSERSQWSRWLAGMSGILERHAGDAPLALRATSARKIAEPSEAIRPRKTTRRGPGRTGAQGPPAWPSVKRVAWRSHARPRASQ